MRRVLLMALALVGAVGWVLLGRRSEDTFLFVGAGEAIAKATRLGAGYLAMMIGVILGVMTRGLLALRDAGQQEVDILRYLAGAWRRTDLWISVFAAPVVYGALAADVALPPLQFLFFALQTGFSSYVAIRSLLEMPPTVTTATKPPST